MSDRPCDICGVPSKALMCTACCRSYDRNGHRDGSLHAALIWAAGRAHRAQRRHVATAQYRALAAESRVAELEASCEVWATLVSAAEAERDRARADAGRAVRHLDAARFAGSDLAKHMSLVAGMLRPYVSDDRARTTEDPT